MRSALVLAACLLPAAATPAFGLDVTGETLEVLIRDASAVGEYRVHASPAEETPYDAWVRTEVRTERIATFFGAPPEEETIPLAVRRDEIRTRLPAAGTELLVIFPGDPEGEPERIPLEGPGGGKSPLHWGAALTADFGVLEDPSSILARVRMAVAARKNPGDRGCGDLIVEESVPDTTAAYRALWDRGRVTLRSLFQERHRQVLRGIAADGQGLARARAVCLLARCSPGDLSDDLLVDMLDDPGSVEAWTGETIHPARGVAYRLLRARGKDVAAPADYREDDRLDLPCGEAALVAFDDRLAMVSHLPCSAFRSTVRETVPEYPLEMLQNGIEGKVEVLISVDPAGVVTGTRIDRVTVDEPPPAIANELREAAFRWRFRPVTSGGTPVGAAVVVPLRPTGDDPPPPARFLGDRAYDDSCAVRTMVLPWPATIPPGSSLAMEVDVDAWGAVVAVRSLEGEDVLPIMRAVVSWTFTPATVHGVPEPATVGLVLRAPRGGLVAETGSRCRFFPAGGVQPDGPLEIVDASLPGHVGLWGWDAMSLDCHIDTHGRVDKVALPGRDRFRPLAEAALEVAENWEFAPERGDPDRICEVRVPFTFRLPLFVPGAGLIHRSSF